MKLWGDMDYADQQGLKAAHHRGWTIQFFSHVKNEWMDCSETHGPSWEFNYAYRVKPETKDADMKLWKDMSDCEKGVLLLAYHQGKTIQYQFCDNAHWNWAKKDDGSIGLGWHDNYYYRVKVEPVIKEVIRYGVADEDAEYCGGFIYSYAKGYQHTHKITFNLVDGVPDCLSIKMIKL